MPLHAGVLASWTSHQCPMTPSSKYAVDTWRIIVTGKVRQGVQEWTQAINYPNNELLGRYDPYPKPSGKESQSASGLQEDTPPTGPPFGQILYPQNGAAGVRFTRGTSASGVSNPSAPPQPTKIKQKIRDLRLRWQPTGKLSNSSKQQKNPAAVTMPPPPYSNCIVVICCGTYS